MPAERAGWDLMRRGSKVAQEAYQELPDGFCEEYQDMVAPQQCRAAKDNPDYFLALIHLAYYDQEYEKVDKQGGQSLH
jgi:hypothetical protein